MSSEESWLTQEMSNLVGVRGTGLPAFLWPLIDIALGTRQCLFEHLHDETASHRFRVTVKLPVLHEERNLPETAVGLLPTDHHAAVVTDLLAIA